jgi:hypothetical protein
MASKPKSQPVTLPVTKPVPLAFIQEQDFAARQYRGRRDNQEDYYAFADATAPDERSLGAAFSLCLATVSAPTRVAAWPATWRWERLCARPSTSRTSLGGLAARARGRGGERNARHHVAPAACRSVAPPMGTTLLARARHTNHPAMDQRGRLATVSVSAKGSVASASTRTTRLAPRSSTPEPKRGELTHEEAAHHPDRHTLQAALLGYAPDHGRRFDGSHAVAERRHRGRSFSDGINTLTDQGNWKDLLSFGRHTTADKIADAIIFAIPRANQRPSGQHDGRCGEDFVRRRTLAAFGFASPSSGA